MRNPGVLSSLGQLCQKQMRRWEVDINNSKDPRFPVSKSWLTEETLAERKRRRERDA